MIDWRPSKSRIYWQTVFEHAFLLSIMIETISSGIPTHRFIDALFIWVTRLSKFFKLVTLCLIWKFIPRHTCQPRIAFRVPRACLPTDLPLASPILTVKRLTLIVWGAVSPWQQVLSIWRKWFTFRYCLFPPCRGFLRIWWPQNRLLLCIIPCKVMFIVA